MMCRHDTFCQMWVELKQARFSKWAGLFVVWEMDIAENFGTPFLLGKLLKIASLDQFDWHIHLILYLHIFRLLDFYFSFYP